MPLVGIVVPTYERYNVLAKCLDSIREFCSGDYRVYVIEDRGSKFDEVKSLVGKFSGGGMRIDLFRTEENLGCGNTRRFGTSIAIKDGCKYIVNTDDDCFLKENSLQSLLKVMEEDEDEEIGMASSTAGGPMEVWFHGIDEEYVPRPYATGSFAMGRSEILRKVGNYDPKCVVRSDAEICMRIWIYGRKCVLVSKCKVNHHSNKKGGLHGAGFRNDFVKEWIAIYHKEKYGELVSLDKRNYILWWRKFKMLSDSDIELLQIKLFGEVNRNSIQRKVIDELRRGKAK